MDSGPFSSTKRWKSSNSGYSLKTVRAEQLRTKHGVNEGIKRLLYQMQTGFPQHYQQIVQGLIQTIDREVDDMYTQGGYSRCVRLVSIESRRTRALTRCSPYSSPPPSLLLSLPPSPQVCHLGRKRIHGSRSDRAEAASTAGDLQRLRSVSRLQQGIHRDPTDASGGWASHDRAQRRWVSNSQ